MLNPLYVENAPQDGFAVLEILSQPDGEGRVQRQFVALRETRLVGEIVGPLASLQLQQTFRFTKQECDHNIEAAYRFPLPGDAAVLGVRIAFGEVEIEAQLRERQQAETEYQEAKSQGKQAALLTRESPDVFTLQVAGIAPDEPVVIETRYVQLVRAREKGYELRIPLTTAPRYTRTDEAGSRHAQGQPLAVMRDPGHRFELHLMVHGATRISSPTHTLDVRQDPGGGTPETQARPATQQVMLNDGKVIPDRDCVIEWQTSGGERPALQAWAGRDGDDEYFLALLSPPETSSPEATLEKIAREVIVLVDHSGSMEGSKWIAADRAVEDFLRRLTPTDYFGLGIFHSTTKWFHPRLVAASPAAIEKAIGFIHHSKDSGGTELGVALEQALHFAPALHTAARHVFVITDGEVTDDGRIVRVVEEQPFPQKRRVSVLCIDTAPNSYLVQEITERTGGVARFLGRPQEEAPAHRSWVDKIVEKVHHEHREEHKPESQLQASINEIMRDWEAPLRLGVQIEVNRAQIASNRQLSRQAIGSQPNIIDAGDLPAGRPLWIIGRTGAQNEPLRLRATDETGTVLDTVAAETVATDLVPALKALFGAKPVLELEYLMQHYYRIGDLAERVKRLGLTMPRPKSVYAENEQARQREIIRQLLVQEALRYGLASAETSFIAVRHDVNRPVETKVTVANALPDQWDAGFATGAVGAVPAGAATMDWMAMDVSVDSMLGSLTPPSAAPSPAAPPSAALGSGRGTFGRARVSKNKARQQADPPTPPAETPTFTLEDVHGEGRVTIFDGQPTFVSGHAILFDSSKLANSDTLMALRRLTEAKRLRIRFAGKVKTLPPDLMLQIWQDGKSQPVQSLSLYALAQQNAPHTEPVDNLLVQDNEYLAPLEFSLAALQSLKVELVSGTGWKGSLTVIVE